jgi:hypothetical protein
MDTLLLEKNEKSDDYTLGGASLVVDTFDLSTTETGSPKEIELLAGEIYEFYATKRLTRIEKAAVAWAEPRLVDQD